MENFVLPCMAVCDINIYVYYSLPYIHILEGTVHGYRLDLFKKDMVILEIPRNTCISTIKQ